MFVIILQASGMFGEINAMVYLYSIYFYNFVFNFKNINIILIWKVNNFFIKKKYI